MFFNPFISNSPKPLKKLKWKPMLRGFAVLFTDGRVEYWVYDPAILTNKQRKRISIAAWKKIELKISGKDRG